MSSLRYRIGLDVGTASVGLVAVSLDEANAPKEVVYADLRIFSEPTLPAKGTGELKNANRRLARQARRGVDRKARRFKRVALLAPLLGINSFKVKPEMSQQIHELRVKALSERIELDDLIRVCGLLAKRRGYAGGFKKVKSEDAEAGEVRGGIEALKNKMNELGVRTLGEYLLWRIQNGKSLKLKNDQEAHLYADRDLVHEEFRRIMDEQRKHHPILDEIQEDPGEDPNSKNKVKKPIHKIIEDAVFFQRPLKSVSAMVGNCPLEPTLPRAPKAQPAAQTFRIEKQIADLRWGSGSRAVALTPEQKSVIREMLHDPSLVTKEGQVAFEKIYKGLEEKDLRPGKDVYFNVHRGQGRKGLTGDRTRRAMSDLGVLGLWDSLSPLHKIQTINFLADLGSPEVCDSENWHENLKRAMDEKDPKSGKWRKVPKPYRLADPIVEFINTIVDSGKFGRLSAMGLETGRTAYSIKALDRLRERMAQTGEDESAAIESCYPAPPPTGELNFKLEAPKPTGNIIVDGSLRMIQRAVNECIDELGVAPAQMVVEMARELPLGVKRRQEIEAKHGKNEAARKAAKKVIAEHGLPPIDRLVFRYLLWKELEDQCPYCENRLSFEEALDGGRSQIDHILPQTLTQVGRKRDQLVLCHTACNGEKNNRTPFEAFGHNPQRWEQVLQAAKRLEKAKLSKKAHLLTIQDYEGEVIDDDTISDFADRQFAETSWIAKSATEWFKEVCTDVSITKGQLVAGLRRRWKLETVIPEIRLQSGLDLLDEDDQNITPEDFEAHRRYWDGHYGDEVVKTDRRINKRIDHRHHLIDALVIAQTDRSLYQRMARAYKRQMEKQRAGDRSVRPSIFEGAEPPLADLAEVARRLVRETPINRKPDRYVSGKLFAETAYRLEEQADGKSYLSLSVPLLGLTDNQGSLDKARKRIEDIVSDRTREIVRDEFEKRISAGKSVKEALSEPIPHPDYGNPITKVQTYYRNGPSRAAGSKAIGIPRDTPQKRYISDGNACVMLGRDESGLNAKTLSMVEARDQALFKIPGVRFLFREDLVRKVGEPDIYRVCQVKDGGTICLTLATETRTFDQCAKVSSLTRITKTVSSAKELHEYEVVN